MIHLSNYILEKLHISKDYKNAESEENIETIEVYDFLNGGTHKFDLNVVYKSKSGKALIVEFPNGKYQDFWSDKRDTAWSLMSDAINEEWPEESWKTLKEKRPKWFTKDVLATEDDLDKYMPLEDK